MAEEINEKRLKIWDYYRKLLEPLALKERISLPVIPDTCVHNAHMFYMKCKNLDERTALISSLKEKEIQAVFHYIPLHTAPAGQKYGEFSGIDQFTTKESERLVRLPLYYGLKMEEVEMIVEAVNEFYKRRFL